jgi:hypothetical protein
MDLSRAAEDAIIAIRETGVEGVAIPRVASNVIVAGRANS